MDNIISAIKYIFYGIFAYIGVDKEAFLILITLMCIDSFVGAIKSVRLGKMFKFSILIWGFVLKLCFLIIPLVVALLGKQLGYNFTAAVNIVISILSVSEGYSTLGNIYSAKNKVEIKKIDIVSMLLTSLRSTISSRFIKIIKKIEEAGECNVK